MTRQWARLIRIFDRVLRRFGVANGCLLSQSLSQNRQFGPPRIDLFVLAIARPGIEIRTAMGAVTLACRTAKGVQGKLEHDAVSQHGLEIDLVVFNEICVVFDWALVCWTHVQLAHIEREPGRELLQTPGTFEHDRCRYGSGHEDALDHALQPKLGMDRFAADVGQSSGYPTYGSIDDDIPVFPGASEYLGYRDSQFLHGRVLIR